MTGWLKAVAAVFGFLRKLAELASLSQARKAGRDEARAQALEREAQELRASQAAANRAAGRHATDATDGAFDSSYRRED